MFDVFKKKSNENNGGEKKLSESEIEQLKQELEEKKEEFRSVYNKYVEAGGTELPDDMLDLVNGGDFPWPSRMKELGDDTAAGTDR